MLSLMIALALLIMAVSECRCKVTKTRVRVLSNGSSTEVTTVLQLGLPMKRTSTEKSLPPGSVPTAGSRPTLVGRSAEPAIVYTRCSMPAVARPDGSGIRVDR